MYYILNSLLYPSVRSGKTISYNLLHYISNIGVSISCTNIIILRIKSGLKKLKVIISKYLTRNLRCTFNTHSIKVCVYSVEYN